MLNSYQQTTAYLILMGTLVIGTPLSLAEETVITHPTGSTVPATSTAAPANTAPDNTLAPQVTRAAFTTGLTAREPNDQLSHISAGQNIYYFTELLNLQGRIITHRWEKDGAFQLGLQFPVGGQRWRVHSNKMIPPNLSGVWKVSVVSDDGSVLHQDTLMVETVATAVEPEPAPQAIWDTLPR